MRQFIFFLAISLFSLSFIPHMAHAQCTYSDANDCTLNSEAPSPQTPNPPTEAGTPIASATPPEPIGTAGEPIDYSETSETVQQDVQSNLTQESEPLASGQCAERTLAPNSTTSKPFVYDGTASSMNVATDPRGGPTRTFISSMPGYDPMNRLAPGASNDFMSSCHSQANLPEICSGDGSNCAPDPNNENSINMRPADTVSANPAGNIGNCPLVAGQTYYVNIQNQGTAPVCTSIGNNTSCPACASQPGGTETGTGGG